MQSWPTHEPSDGYGLYIHVPFCVRKCPYCDFASAVARRGDPRRYLEALARELSALPADFRPTTIFIGGGTPTELSPASLQRLTDLVRSSVPCDRVAEWTCEVNPGTFSLKKARILRAAGVNRLSIGAQSFRDPHLRWLGRIHSAAAIGETVAIAREAGFERLSLDLMYALPGQTLEQWMADVERALVLGPDHLSLYALTIEEGTPFFEARAAGRRMEADEDTALAQYTQARRRLRQAGFTHYEISNFARPGSESRHNLLYWTGGRYIGCGPAAHSFWDGVRRANFPRLEDWADALSRGERPVRFEERLEPEAQARETFVFGLRRIAGWRRDEFRAVTGFDYDALYGSTLARLAQEGLIEKPDDSIRLAESALFISDTVFRELI